MKTDKPETGELNAPKKKKSLSKKILKVLAIILAAVLVILLGARLYFRIPVSEYYSHSEKEFTIPDINSGFIAQGFTSSDENVIYAGEFYRAEYYKTKQHKSPLLENPKKQREGFLFCACGKITPSNLLKIFSKLS